MYTFLKLHASSLIATAFDWLITLALTELFNCWYLLSGIAGTICGGGINFIVNRNWVFSAKGTKALEQAYRYVLAWTGYLLLSALGLHLLTGFLKINYMASKVILSVILGITYNFLMQKHFVFGKK